MNQLRIKNEELRIKGFIIYSTFYILHFLFDFHREVL